MLHINPKLFIFMTNIFRDDVLVVFHLLTLLRRVLCDKKFETRTDITMHVVAKKQDFPVILKQMKS